MCLRFFLILFGYALTSVIATRKIVYRATSVHPSGTPSPATRSWRTTCRCGFHAPVTAAGNSSSCKRAPPRIVGKRRYARAYVNSARGPQTYRGFHLFSQLRSVQRIARGMRRVAIFAARPHPQFRISHPHLDLVATPRRRSRRHIRDHILRQRQPRALVCRRPVRIRPDPASRSDCFRMFSQVVLHHAKSRRFQFHSLDSLFLRLFKQVKSSPSNSSPRPDSKVFRSSR
jgi:hypothetical protein